MVNRSHLNSGHRMMNKLNKENISHSSSREAFTPEVTQHIISISDCVDFLKTLPSKSVQLILIDPPYNIDMAHWDTFSNYIDWAKAWITESERILKDTGSFVIFGGIQFENEKSGDLLELMHYIRHHSPLRIVNLIIWYYKNGMSAHRFFANRHEEIAWYVKSKKYIFNLDAVRVPYDEEKKKLYSKDKRLNLENLEKGKNPTNVWEIGRLNGNSNERVGHPTQKPQMLIQRLIKSLSNPGDSVLDFFAGSGTTTKVCIDEGRHSIAVDMSSTLHSYLELHLKNGGQTLWTPPYKIITDVEDFEQHPVYKKEAT